MRVQSLFALLLTLLSLNLFAQQSYNIELLSRIDNDSLPLVDGDQVWNDCMGYKDYVKNREYLIAGSTDSIYFFDITNPRNPVKCAVKEGHSRYSINRDYEVYSHYSYCVSDKSSPPGSLQIFDLQYLPDSVHLVYDRDTFSVNTHTLFVDSSSKRLYLCGNLTATRGNLSMAILSLANPERPVFIGELPKTYSPYTHEVYVRNDTAYCSNGYQGLYIWDLRNINSPAMIGSINSYPNLAYNHSSWLDSTGKYIVFQDEQPDGRPLYLYDIRDLNNPKLKTTFNSHPGAVPHNGYWKGNFLYVSSYKDGLYIYDMSNPDSLDFPRTPPIVAFYDTYPLNGPGDYGGYHGCWGTWPFLPSGNILISDMSEGLFVVRPRYTLGIHDEIATPAHIRFYPNPFQNSLTLKMQVNKNENARIEVFGMHGAKMMDQRVQMNAGFNEVEFYEFKEWPAGMYLFTIHTSTEVRHQQVIKY